MQIAITFLFLTSCMVCLVAVLLPGGTSHSVLAAPGDSYLKIEGLRGESRAPGHDGWIDVQDLVIAFAQADINRPSTLGELYNGTQAVTNNSSSTQPSPNHKPSSTPPGRASGSPPPSGNYTSSLAGAKNPNAVTSNSPTKLVSMVKKVDSSSLFLRQAMATQKVFSLVVIESDPQKAAGVMLASPITRTRIQIQDATITAIQPVFAGPAPAEKITFKSSKVLEQRY